MKESLPKNKRDYKKEPNRFTLKMLYNDELIVTTDRNGIQRAAQRDFDFPFKEPRFLGNNPYKIIQDKNNKPHQTEEGIFENSWQAVEMGEALIEIFRLKLREGTEDYISNYRNINYSENNSCKPAINYEDFNNNSFTLVLVDNKSIKRDNSGQILNLKSLMTQIDELKEKNDFGGLNNRELSDLKNLEEELARAYIKREIFRCSFSADDFSYDGKDFTPPLSLVWKDFNVYFKNPTQQTKKSGINFADLDSYGDILNSLSELKRKRRRILEQLEEAESLIDNIRLASLEKSLTSMNSEISSRENIYFKGLRSKLKEYLNLEEYDNRFTTPRTMYNNFYTYSSEGEILKSSFA